ncbi:MAG: dihydropteroate synthase [Bacteroidota bacterium]|nr:dihydropteroate synthase [Bacteroidota bacterium]
MPQYVILYRNISESEKPLFEKISISDNSFRYNKVLNSALYFFNNLSTACFDKFPNAIKELSLIALSNFNDSISLKMPINGKIFDFNFAYLMGILNVTPDSFSDGGSFMNKDKAVDYGLKMLDEGADIIDIGGESTRPGSDFVSADEELKRVLPVIAGIKKLRPGAVISVDTNKSEVAKKSFDEGADIINDISGGIFDPEIFRIVKNADAVYILMHIKGTPKDMQHNVFYDNLIEDIYSELNTQLQIAQKAGLNKIIIDPGIGFGKTAEQNLDIIERISDFRSLGFPILIGLSRKGFLGKLFNYELNDRDFPSSIADTISLLNGARIIRTHNVKNCRIVCNIFNKMI